MLFLLLKDCYYDINFFSKQIKNQILNLIKPYIEKNYSLYLTGRSSESANATLLSYFINEKYPNTLIKLVTFGSPNVGNEEWKNVLKTNII